MALSSRHFRKASLCKQTAYYNRTSSQAKTQPAVTARRLRSRLHCLFIHHHTVAPYRNRRRPVGHDAPLNPDLSSDKRCREFSLLGGSEASWKVLSCSHHSAIQRVLDWFFLCPTTFRDRGQVGLQLQQRPQKKGRFQKTDPHQVGPWRRHVTTKPE